MKKLVSIIILCLGCLGILGAQNVWKPISSNSPILGAASNGDLYAMGGYSGLLRSQDEGETWQVVLGYETGFSGYFNQHCFAVSPEGRICVFNDNQQTVVYSDDGGDTWQQTPSISSCAMPDKTGLCVPTNDIMVVWAENGEISYTLDGGETWESWIPDFMNADNGPVISDFLVNENGDVYLGLTTLGGDGGISHSTLSDIQNWEFVAAEGISIKDMAFDPEGNVVACGWKTEGSVEFQHTPGFYLFDGTSLAIGNDGNVYTPHFMGLQAVLSYSTDHGEHFTEIGEHLPLVDIAPGGENGRLFKGADNHLFFDGGGEYWKSIRNADEIISQHRPFAPQGAEWYFDVFNPWGMHPEYRRFFVDGDTIIQGHQCSIIRQNFVDTGHEGGEFVYEEDNKVYWFNPTTNAFTTLYDFDAEAGESWDYEVGECSHQVTVDSIGSVTWNGHTYRTQWVRFNEDVQYYSGKIIEGIGYEKGLFPSIYVCDGLEVYDASEIEYLRCYVKDGDMLYHEGTYACDYPDTAQSGPEWYYEILNDDGSITYQYMYQAGDTIINDEPTHILVKINTLYDKGLRDEVTHEYIQERDGKVYWWNKTLGMFTVLYDYEAEAGDVWEIKVGAETLDMHVDVVEDIEYEGRVWRMLHVSDPGDIFSGNIVCGIGHLTSFFPERLMRNTDGFRVEGLRCYWVEDELVFKYGEEDCDAILSDIHGIEEGGLSMGSETITVYPNPTDGVLFVETRLIASLPATYHITNLMGQTILSGNITAEIQQINVKALPQGMYFITVGEGTRKFVVN